MDGIKSACNTRICRRDVCTAAGCALLLVLLDGFAALLEALSHAVNSAFVRFFLGYVPYDSPHDMPVLFAISVA